MECCTMLLGILGLFTYFCELPTLAETKRIIEGKSECLVAKMEDINELTEVRRGRKRKVDDCKWIEEGDELVKKAKRLLGPVEGWKSFLMSAKLRWDLWFLDHAINHHSKKGDLLMRRVFSDAEGPCPGYYLPVKPLVGQVASRNLDCLEHLLKDDDVRGIVIHGEEGIGKTFFMKHLHNHACTTFKYVFWLSFPLEFSIKSVQDALAVVVKCDFSCDDDIVARANKLSNKFADLGNYVLFLDGVLKTDFPFNEVGIPVPGTKCKLVLATRSSLAWSRMFSCFEKIELKRLPKEDAYELFMREANIREESVSLLGGGPSYLSDTCGGLPRAIVNLANIMCSIDDPHEWSCAQYEVGELGKKKKHPVVHLGESETNASTSKAMLTKTPRIVLSRG